MVWFLSSGIFGPSTCRAGKTFGRDLCPRQDQGASPGRPTSRSEYGVLDVGVEVEGVAAAFAADTGLAVAPEGRTEVADEEAVHPDRAGIQSGTDPFRAVEISGDQGGGKAEASVVGHLDGLLF